MTFYKVLSAFIIALSAFSSNVFSIEIEIDPEDPPHSSISVSRKESAKPLDKYESAIETCRSCSGKWDLYANDVSDVYEKAMKICGTDNYRLYPITVWRKNIVNFFDSDNYERLISVELHHIAGDMLHIARLVKDATYREKVNSAIKYAFKETWVEENAGSYSTWEIRDLKIPNMPEEYYNTRDSLCEAFIEMISLFKQWDELQKTSMGTNDLRAFYRQIESKYNDDKICRNHPKGNLLRYRKQRKLSLFWHPTYYNKYSSRAYSQARERELLITASTARQRFESAPSPYTQQKLRGLSSLYTVYKSDPPHVAEYKKKHRPQGRFYHDEQ